MYRTQELKGNGDEKYSIYSYDNDTDTDWIVCESKEEYEQEMTRLRKERIHEV